MRKKGKALSRHTINTPQITPVCYGYPHCNQSACRTDRSSSALSRLSCQYFKSMFHYRKNCFQIFFYRFRTARKIHDQRMISDRGNSSAQHCPRRHFRRSCSHRLCIPGTFRCATAIVASGVQSRKENPVPPVVNTISTFSSSQSVHRHFSISFCSSGRSSVLTTSYP